LHVRRGEQLALASSRLLPNSYFITAALSIANILDAIGISYQIELHTEIPSKDFMVYPDHHGINRRIAEPVRIGPSLNAIEELDLLPHLVKRINASAIDCLTEIATSDIIVMSRSSFSYVAAVLSRNDTIVIYHPFWHAPLSPWIHAKQDGTFIQEYFSNESWVLFRMGAGEAGRSDAASESLSNAGVADGLAAEA
jgi:hypothetical protein